MANKRYYVNKELDITLSLKVKVTELNNYYHLSEKEREDILGNLVNDFKGEFEWRLQNTIKRLDGVVGCDYVYFEIEE